MKRTSLAILAALACTSAAFAIGLASAQPSETSSPSSQLDAFVGDGTCTGQIMAMGKQPGRATAGKYHGEKTLDGHWVVVSYEEDQSVAAHKPFKVVNYFGYDPAKKQFISVFVANADAAYGTSVTSRWKGNSITFDEADPPGSKHVVFRDTFTVGESGMASHTGTMRDKHGKWVKTDEETCHKA